MPTFHLFQFKHDIPEPSAQPGQSILAILLLYLYEWLANANLQGFGYRPELNYSLVAFFTFVDLGEQFKRAFNKQVSLSPPRP